MANYSKSSSDKTPNDISQLVDEVIELQAKVDYQTRLLEHLRRDLADQKKRKAWLTPINLIAMLYLLGIILGILAMITGVIKIK
jgi:hypothetical protein